MQIQQLGAKNMETRGRKQEIRVDVGPSLSIFIRLTLDLIHKRYYSNPNGEPEKKNQCRDCLYSSKL